MKYITSLLAASAMMVAAPAIAQDTYVSLSGGIKTQSDSDNNGAFSSDFTTGQGSDAIPLGTPLPAGTDVGWTTDFKSGYHLNAAIGKDMGALRFEGELSLEKAKVDTHTGVSAAGLDLTSQDAAVLITGQATGLGVTVGNLVADGQGDIKSTSVFANVFYDIETDSAITPYVGGGIGYGWNKVDYSPSATPIIDDKDNGFVWQAMAGAAFAVSDRSAITAGVRYRDSSDLEVDASLFPATFEVENTRTLFEVGYRLGF
ncbi:outer membrane protein [Litorimonas sp. RW-G-Af-16]|uniref:outer membrane protein n=1 Tax=Litorimonas sp. RW-G-Af-16 TaxID=3241168 RepID=UPI00390C41F9